MIDFLLRAVAAAFLITQSIFTQAMAAEGSPPSGDFRALFERCSSYIIDEVPIDVSNLKWLTYDERQKLDLRAPGLYFYITDSSNILNVIDSNQCGVLNWGKPTHDLEVFVALWTAGHPAGIRRVHDLRRESGYLRRRYFSENFDVWLTTGSDGATSAVTFVKMREARHVR